MIPKWLRILMTIEPVEFALEPRFTSRYLWLPIRVYKTGSNSLLLLHRTDGPLYPTFDMIWLKWTFILGLHTSGLLLHSGCSKCNYVTVSSDVIAQTLFSRGGRFLPNSLINESQVWCFWTQVHAGLCVCSLSCKMRLIIMAARGKKIVFSEIFRSLNSCETHNYKTIEFYCT